MDWNPPNRVGPTSFHDVQHDNDNDSGRNPAPPSKFKLSIGTRTIR